MSISDWSSDVCSSDLLTLEISGRQLLLEPVQRDGDRVHVGDFYPCSVLLNNDLSAGIPDILKGITQDVVPSPNVGWHMRQKSNHFGFYREVAREFAEIAGIAPWLETGRASCREKGG